METKDYIRIHRAMLDEPIFKIGPYDCWHAWCDLVLCAFFGPRKLVTRGKILTAPEGCMYVTYTSLVRKWGWTTGRVQRFLKKLSDEGKIKIEVDKVICIQICESNLMGLCAAEYPTKDIKENKVAEKPIIKKTKSEKTTNVPTLVTKCRKVFETKYVELFEAAYYWQAKDAASMKQLIDKLKYARKNRGLENKDEDITNALMVLLNTITDKWILGNFSVCNINSKFNEIVAQARLTINGHGTERLQRQYDAINVIDELAKEERSTSDKVW